MKISVKLTVICTLHWFYITLGQTAKVTSRCAAPPAELMKEATVTCVFPIDVRLSKIDFDVYHEKEVVANCIWVYGRLDCSVKSGNEQDYQMDTNSFTLRIPNFLQNQTGRYSCALDGYDAEECSLSKRTDSSLTPETNSNRNVTNNDEKTPNTVLIKVLPTVFALFAIVVIAAVVMHFVCKRFRIKKNARTPDNVPTVGTGGDAKESFGTPLIERKPTPESTAGQQAYASISLMSEIGDRTEFREHCNTSSLQQQQIDRHWRKKDCGCDYVTHTPTLERASTPRNYCRCCQHNVIQGCVGHDPCQVSGKCGRCGPTELHVTKVIEDSPDEDEHCIPSRRKDCGCDHVTQNPTLERASTPRNHSRCCKHDVIQGCVESRGHDPCQVCGRCRPTEELHVTKATADSPDKDKYCIDDQTRIKREQSGTRAETSKLLECQLNQKTMQVLREDLVEKATGNCGNSKLTEEAMLSHSEEKTDDCITSANTQVTVR